MTSGLSGFDLKRIMRTGTVASVDNRKWELAGMAGESASANTLRSVCERLRS